MHNPVETDTSSEVSTKITASLVTQVRVPAQSGVEMTGSLQRLCLGSRDGLRLFEPDSQWIGKRGLEAEESLVTVSQTGDVQVILKNPGGELRVDLEGDQIIGTLSSCTEVESTRHVREEVLNDLPERRAILGRKLDFTEFSVTDPMIQEVREVVISHSKVFALNGTELGCTNKVEHAIETGDHEPIRKHPYREAISLRKKIRGLIQDM